MAPSSHFHRLLLFCCLLITPSLASVQKVENKNDTDSNTFLDVLRDYNKRERPKLGEQRSIPIEISMHFLDFSNLNYESSEITSNFYFRQTWPDPRLACPSVSKELRFTANDGIVEKIWTPDTFFINGKQSYIHQTTIPNVFLRINQNGTVMLSSKISLTSHCPISLKRFPKDVHTCSIAIASYGFLKDDLFYKWKDSNSSVTFSPDINLPGFSLTSHKPHSLVKKVGAGEYSQVTIDLTFARKYGSYIFHYFLPASILVCMSWLAFWFPPSARTIRLTISVITAMFTFFLTVITSALLPRADSLKSIDIYMDLCFLFTIISLLENLFVMFIHTPRSPTPKEQLSEEFPLHDVEYQPSSKADLFSRVIFILLFIIFNVVYWIYISNAY